MPSCTEHGTGMGQSQTPSQQACADVPWLFLDCLSYYPACEEIPGACSNMVDLSSLPSSLGISQNLACCFARRHQYIRTYRKAVYFAPEGIMFPSWTGLLNICAGGTYLFSVPHETSFANRQNHGGSIEKSWRLHWCS